MEGLNKSSDLGLGSILSCTRHSLWAWVRSGVASPETSRSQSYDKEETRYEYMYFFCMCGGGEGYLQPKELIPASRRGRHRAGILQLASRPCCGPLVPFRGVGPRRPHPFTHSAHVLSGFSVSPVMDRVLRMALHKTYKVSSLRKVKIWREETQAEQIKEMNNLGRALQGK